MNEDVHTALDGNTRARAVGRMRHHELAAAVGGLGGGTHGLDRHDHDQIRSGKGACEEFQRVGAAVELATDQGRSRFCAGQLGQSEGGDVERAPAWWDEARPGRQDGWPRDLAALDAPTQRQGLREPGAGVEHPDHAVRCQHRAHAVGQPVGGRCFRRAERFRGEVDVAVPEPSHDRAPRAIDQGGACRYAHLTATPDAREDTIADDDDTVRNHGRVGRRLHAATDERDHRGGRRRGRRARRRPARCGDEKQGRDDTHQRPCGDAEP